MGILQIVAVIVLLILIVKPLGTYIYHIFSNLPNRTDRVFGPIEKVIYKIVGLKNRSEMTWKKYALSLITLNIAFVHILDPA